MTELTNNNLFSNSYKIIRDFLKNIPGIDPRGRFKTNLVHSSMPYINDKGFDGYPFIVLKVDVSEEERHFDTNIGLKIFRVMITIYSTSDTDIDTMSDLIINNVKDETKLNEFSGKEIASSPINWTLDQNGKKVLNRNLGIILRQKI